MIELLWTGFPGASTHICPIRVLPSSLETSAGSQGWIGLTQLGTQTVAKCGLVWGDTAELLAWLPAATFLPSHPSTGASVGKATSVVKSKVPAPVLWGQPQRPGPHTPRGSMSGLSPLLPGAVLEVMFSFPCPLASPLPLLYWTSPALLLYFTNFETGSH